MKPLSIIFTSVGRRVELMRAFRRAADRLGIPVRLVGLDINPLAPALQVVDAPYIVPRLSDPSYIPTLVSLCEREGASRVFPLIDPDIRVLAQHRAELEATGARVAAVPVEAADITDDKWKTSAFFRGLGLPVPRSWLPHEVDPAQAEYPLFIKPRNGSASHHTFKVRDARELTFFRDYITEPIIQELLPGPEITTDVVCDVDGSVLGVVSRRRIEVRGGEVAKGITVHDPAIIDACVRIAAALPAIGPITVQCMLKDGEPRFTEINARLGGGVPLGIAAGVDGPALLLARAAGLAIDAPPIGEYRVGLYTSRFDDSFMLTEDDREAMARRRL